jgi:hypothetical protein
MVAEVLPGGYSEERSVDNLRREARSAVCTFNPSAITDIYVRIPKLNVPT